MNVISSFPFERINKVDRDFSQWQILSFVCPMKYHVPLLAFIPSIVNRLQRWRVSWMRLRMERGIMQIVRGVRPRWITASEISIILHIIRKPHWIVFRINGQIVNKSPPNQRQDTLGSVNVSGWLSKQKCYIFGKFLSRSLITDIFYYFFLKITKLLMHREERSV